MATPVYYDRVKESTTTTGTGDITLAGAATGFQAFSVVGNQNLCPYSIANTSAGEWENGIATYNSGPNTLSRTTVLSSSNSGALVNFSAGTKDVFLDYPSAVSFGTTTGNLKSGEYFKRVGDNVVGDDPTNIANFQLGLLRFLKKSKIPLAEALVNNGLPAWQIFAKILYPKYGIVSVGTFSSLPNVNTSLLGSLYLASDTNVLYCFNGTSWVSTARPVLTSAITYYVSTTGNDSNNGLTAATPFLTIQSAVNTACIFDNAGFNITIQIADGTYTAATTLYSYVGNGTITIQGNSATPSNVIISTTGAEGFTLSSPAVWIIKNMQLQVTGTNLGCLDAGSSGAIIKISNLIFGTSTGIHMIISDNGKIYATGDYQITGNAQFHYYLDNGTLWSFGRTVTITGTPAWTTAFINAIHGGIANSYSMTFSGSATGVRYTIASGGIIETGAGGANYFPGNSAGSGGTTTGGGFYI